MIGNTAKKHAPWYVVPADHKWFTHLLISSVIVDTLESLQLQYPKVDPEKKKQLGAARKQLQKE
jgi:Polyphosphate kinase 2 (PPK2)